MREDIINSIGEEYYNKLDIEGFSNMMKDPSYCLLVGSDSQPHLRRKCNDHI